MRKWIVLVCLAAASAAPGQWANDNAADLLGEAYVRTLYPGMRLANAFGLPNGDTWTTNGFTAGTITLAGVSRTTWPTGSIYAEEIDQFVGTTNTPAWPNIWINGISVLPRLSYASTAYNWGDHAAAGYVAATNATYLATVAAAAAAVPTNDATYLATVAAAAAAVQQAQTNLWVVASHDDLVRTNHTGDVSISGKLAAGSYPAKQVPHFLTGTNITVSADYMLQAITNITGATTINWPAGDATADMWISLTLPATTNTITLASTNWVSYTFISPLTSGGANVGTNRPTRMICESLYGSTNATVTVTESR